MENPFFERPILNSPYDYPQRHWELDSQGQPTQRIVDDRRKAEFITPIPKPKKRRSKAQQDIVFDEGKGLSTKEQQYDPTSNINAVRGLVDRWRKEPPSRWLVTPETARLLQHWRHHRFSGVRPFFCQVEAVETAIWLAEVAPQSASGKDILKYLANANRDANPELLRVALKLATGAGKTTVMAMLIAWQTVNAVRYPNNKNFTRGFLVVTPGITIKDRLRVLQPNDPDSYYESRELVPNDMLNDLNRAKIVITNYHAFKLRERIDVARGTRAVLEGWQEEKLQTLETEGQMLQRVMPDLMGMKNVLALNDEAHHCYREKPEEADDEELTGDEKKEAEKNNEAARLWITGLEAVKRKLKSNRVIDLSATPFFLSGSGYAEGTLFPWTISDFSLMDAIECGIVKLPRVPVAENIPGDENVHRVRAVMDEVFGEENFVAQIAFKKMLPLGSTGLPSISDHILWFAKSIETTKLRDLYQPKPLGAGTGYTWLMTSSLEKRKMSARERQNPEIIDRNDRAFFADNLMSSGYTATCFYEVHFEGKMFPQQKYSWKTNALGMSRLIKANRIIAPATLPNYLRYFDDFAVQTLHNIWDDTHGATAPVYVVQTSNKVIERCILMATDPGDLVLDPTCGSGTTAYVAEQWGRRWITVDTSRVALALARMRIMGARYPYYLLADSLDGQKKEAEITGTAVSSQSVYGKIRQGFVYERVSHITLKSIANNAEIDVIWDTYQEKLEPIREQLNKTLKKTWEEWEIPRDADAKWSDAVRKLHAEWWKNRIARQKEIDASIAAKAEFEFLYDKPYEDKKKVRVAGPFTVESLSPHRMLIVNENDDLVDPLEKIDGKQTFPQMIMENLKMSGVQQAHKEDRITFTSLTAWPGEFVCGEGRYREGDKEKRAAVFIGPEFGTVQRPDLAAAAREAIETGFDLLVACAFNYEVHATDFNKLGPIPVLKARMNADLHMGKELKNTGSGNLFVIFGEPDVDLLKEKDGRLRVKVNGVDIFKPQTGEIESANTDGIACWFLDTDYNEESFFVRHAYFLGASDPYKSLKTTLKAEIDADAWATLNSDISRPFEKPKSGRIAVKIINHLGDEVMKVFQV